MGLLGEREGEAVLDKVTLLLGEAEMDGEWVRETNVDPERETLPEREGEEEEESERVPNPNAPPPPLTDTLGEEEED